MMEIEAEVSPAKSRVGFGVNDECVPRFIDEHRRRVAEVRAVGRADVEEDEHVLEELLRLMEFELLLFCNATNNMNIVELHDILEGTHLVDRRHGLMRQSRLAVSAGASAREAEEAFVAGVSFVNPINASFGRRSEGRQQRMSRPAQCFCCHNLNFCE